jgi:hypothetical protein
VCGRYGAGREVHARLDGFAPCDAEVVLEQVGALYVCHLSQGRLRGKGGASGERRGGDEASRIHRSSLLGFEMEDQRHGEAGHG